MTDPSRPTMSNPRGPLPKRLPSGCRIRAHDLPGLGLVLQAVLFGRQDAQFWEDVQGPLREEVATRSPQYLVFDLSALECVVGAAFLGVLVAGAFEMKTLRKFGRTRIVARGEIARRLTKILKLCKLESVLGVAHPDLQAALASLTP